MNKICSTSAWHRKKNLQYNRTYSRHYVLLHIAPANGGSHADQQRNPFSVLSASLRGTSVHFSIATFSGLPPLINPFSVDNKSALKGNVVPTYSKYFQSHLPITSDKASAISMRYTCIPAECACITAV